MLRWTEPGTGERIIDVVLSLNQQAKQLHTEDVALASYSDVSPTLPTLDKVVYEAQALQRELAGLEGHPGQYIREMLAALECFARLLQGDAIPYRESIAVIQQLPVAMIPEENIRALTDRLERQLAERGFRGTAAEKIKAYLERHRLKPDEVTPYAESILGKARDATQAMVRRLPAGEGIDGVKPIRGVYWSGFSEYVGGYRGTVTFNVERPWSVPTFVNILTHEAYPGHQTFYAHWDALFQAGRLPLEASFYFTGTPTNALFEGAPETGLHFLGWDDNQTDAYFTAEEKSDFRLGRDILDLQKIYQTNASVMVNALGAEPGDAIGYMTASGLMGELEAGNSVRFFTDPLQKTYYPSYYYGKWMVHRAYDRFPVERRPEFFEILYDTPHTTNTFIQAVEAATGEAFQPFAGL